MTFKSPRFSAHSRCHVARNGVLSRVRESLFRLSNADGLHHGAPRSEFEIDDVIATVYGCGQLTSRVVLWWELRRRLRGRLVVRLRRPDVDGIGMGFQGVGQRSFRPRQSQPRLRLRVEFVPELLLVTSRHPAGTGPGRQDPGLCGGRPWVQSGRVRPSLRPIRLSGHERQTGPSQRHAGRHRADGAEAVRGRTDEDPAPIGRHSLGRILAPAQGSDGERRFSQGCYSSTSIPAAVERIKTTRSNLLVRHGNGGPLSSPLRAASGQAGAVRVFLKQALDVAHEAIR